jgi:photosystem II stability/assembly factor-like uncharacterized protein
MKSRPVSLLIALLSVVLVQPHVGAQDDGWLKALRYRPIGPFRGGRSAACTGVPGKPNLFYFGSTGGGVWRSRDAGTTWQNISDGFFGGSIGAVAVSPSDPNVIYVGGGEKTVRGNVSHGSGMWKSTDAGETWKSIGLTESHHIPRIRIHPQNPDLVYAAVLGRLYGPSEQRGVFRSKDGGATWERVLFVHADAGAVDLILDPNNPRIIYASTWRVRRTPYSLESGGPGSGLWKSTDGGDTWTEITRREGLPQGTVGIIGVAVSPVNSQRVWAIVEAEDGGVFRSDNGGKTWSRVNEDRNLRQRAWYYTRIYASPKNIDEVYVVNVALHKSLDGGKSFQTVLQTPHGDHHDLWIDPDEPQRMIVADDGGAQVSVDGGESWSTYHNQPTAQFYRVTTDNHFPYRIYGAQQDNSTVRIRSRSDGFAITERDWEPTAGGESGHIAVHPKDPEIVYGGSYGGFLQRYNHRTKETRTINVWPDNPIGHGAADLKYRFQWNFPIFFSPHDPNVLYAAGNLLFKTTNEGQTWIPISPDLTRNDKSKQGPSGGPITKDNTSVEYYCTIFAALESPHEPGVLWCGSDDGLIHLSRDGGKTWSNVTPPQLPEWTQINSMEAHPFEKGGLYVAATRYKLDDFKPYLLKTTDYGKTWSLITQGIPRDHFTRVVRADPKRRGLLYCGTEAGIYMSWDDGANWKPFQLNLPIVPVTDLAIKEDDLVVATQGRSFWVLDDLTVLHQWQPDLLNKPFHLLVPRTVHRLVAGGGGELRGRSALLYGENPPAGAVIRFHVKDELKPETKAVLEIVNDQGRTVRRFTRPEEPGSDGLALKKGMNQIIWNLRHPDAEGFPGMILWGSLTGPKVRPGKYQVKLTIGEQSEVTTLHVLPDPRSTAKPDDFVAQEQFLLAIRDKLTETHRAIKAMRDIRQQLQTIEQRLKDDTEIRSASVKLAHLIDQIEDALYQTKARSGQDLLNFPVRLNNKLASLADDVGDGDFRPTDSAEQVRREITAAIDVELARWRRLLADDLPAFNALLARKKVPGVFVEKTPEAAQP